MNDPRTYNATDDDTKADPLAIVASALRAAGVRQFRPAPQAAQAYQPRHARRHSMMEAA